MISDLVSHGHEANRIRQEIVYLIRNACIIPEHLRYDSVSDEDLIHLSPAGAVHLRLLKNVDYLAACAEDTWYDNQHVAENIRERIASPRHFNYKTTLLNAEALLNYLAAQKSKVFPQTQMLMKSELLEDLHGIEDPINAVSRSIDRYNKR